MKKQSIFIAVFLLSSLFISIFLESCGSSRKTGFALMREVYDEDIDDILDSTEKKIYITDTKPIDSIDVNKLIYDIWRIETDEYPENLKVYARVYDSSGNFVTNMADPYKKEGDSNTYFTRIDERLGKHYNVRDENIEQFNVREYGANDSIPYNIVMTVDYSGSMSAVMDAIYMGTELFVGMKFPYDNIALTSFNKELDVKVPLLNEKKKILNLYRKKRTKGFGLFSACWDAMNQCIDTLITTPKEDPRVLVLFTDGDDNYSKTKIGDLIEKAKANKINVFCVAFGYSKDENLRYLAKYTGGKFYKAYSKKELIAIFRDIYMSLRYYYYITYKAPLYYGFHTVFSELMAPGRADSLIGIGEYDTSDLVPWDSIGKAFEKPILFEFDSAAIRPESYYILDGIADIMLAYPKLRIEIQGHTDNIGPLANKVEYNQKLSEDRANAVRTALIQRGIEPVRLRSRGFGMSQPVANNETEEGRAKNRRTAFLIIAK